ncbi:membrane protein [Mycobacterium rhizamassiliense]|uniref:Membrane protein n=2 Tax=Mycobacterium rhizamassiliense TaxID=1841860 RepID=A0A2U3NR47_9MYCO|nr:septum formation family protein [Mycobacterium rhizamassiliense]SPM33913.1 membrane protein [Mycobacterium rhizamassiliense]
MSDTLETEASSAAPPAGKAQRSTAGFGWPNTLQAAATRRALLLTALGGLLIAGLVTAIPVDSNGGRLAGYMNSAPVPSTGAKSDAAFNRATTGDCLMWPDVTPESARIVSCADDHKFEVAESIDMRTFPGAEYGPNAAPPSPARIQQISQEQCEAAVHRYLGPKFDPNSKFTVSMLWAGDRAWRQSGERRMLCGLQLPGTNNTQATFKGKVSDVDQSKVWPAGTCLGIDPSTNQPVDVPVDCGAPHAMEVTGTVNLAEKFPGALPAEPDQDGFIKDACTKMTDAFLAPVKLRTTTLTLIYPTLSLPTWSAGSREVACSIGATLGNGGWATLLNSAKGHLLINGQPPVPPPDIPEERLTAPLIPVQVPAPQAPPSQSSGPPEMPPNNQHLPQQQPVVTPQHSPASQAPQAPPQAPPPPDNGLPPGSGPPLDAPPPPAPGGSPLSGGPPPPRPRRPADATSARRAPAGGLAGWPCGWSRSGSTSWSQTHWT